MYKQDLHCKYNYLTKSKHFPLIFLHLIILSLIYKLGYLCMSKEVSEIIFKVSESLLEKD